VEYEADLRTVRRDAVIQCSDLSRRVLSLGYNNNNNNNNNIFAKLQLGFSPVAVVQQYNRQVTHITHKQNTNIIQKQQHNTKTQQHNIKTQ
jgi:hypothetical protein